MRGTKGRLDRGNQNAIGYSDPLLMVVMSGDKKGGNPRTKKCYWSVWVEKIILREYQGEETGESNKI